ncbi:hypothetical protein ABRZ24_01510 [Brenneria populi]|uniref:Uncharacterized protein n=1 Tax=Brenneria populi TaxID=1505588 RepID=A0ABU6JKT8_9GAMM|nr:hypothetical protein [Brenneria populi Li et al. 2015]
MKDLYLFELNAITEPPCGIDAGHCRDRRLDAYLLTGVAQFIDTLDSDSWKVIIPHGKDESDAYWLKDENSASGKNFIYCNTYTELIDFIKKHKEYAATLFINDYLDAIDPLVKLNCKVILIDKNDDLLPPHNCLYANNYLNIQKIINP